MPDGQGLPVLERWLVPPSCAWVVLLYRDLAPFHCALEWLPEIGERVVYYGKVLTVADRKYTLPMFGRPETWLRLEATS